MVSRIILSLAFWAIVQGLAFAQIKISEMPPAASVSDADLTMIVQAGANKQATAGLLRQILASNITDSTTVGRAMVKVGNPSAVRFLRVNADNSVTLLDASSFLTAIGGGASTWGAISGTLSNQTDLQAALDAKLATNGSGSALTGLNFTQLAGTATDAQVPNNITITGLSGTNSGDVTLAGAPTYITISGQVITKGLIGLASDVSGDLPFANLTQGTALSVLGVAGNATADVASVSASLDGQSLRRNGTTIGFGAIDLASANAITGILPDGNIPTTIARDSEVSTAVANINFTQLLGTASDAQIPNNITVDLATLATTATTATTANAGDSATAFFPAGQIERARGGTAADTSAFGNGLIGSDVSNATIDVDTIAEFSTALGTTGTPSATTYFRGDNTWATVASGGAPTTATYITQTADGTLTNEQALGLLATGLVKNTTTTGVLSIAAAGTDYVTPTGSGATLTGLTFTQLGGTATDAQIPDNITITGLSGTNTGDVTLAGTPTYITISGQTITRNLINLATDTGTTADFSGKTSLSIPSGTAPTTSAAAQVAFDTNAWAASRGAIQSFDGTANAYAVATQVSDTPVNGQVPKWNTGGTITWEDDITASAGTGDFSSNTSTSVDGEFLLFSGTLGKTGRRATGTGIARSTSGVYSAAELSGDATTSGSNAVTVSRLNGTSLAGLATGLLKNTTATGVPSIAVAGTDYLLPSGSGAALTGITFSQLGGTAADAQIPDNITITGLSGTNTGDVTLAGAPDYITISGQTITRGLIDLATDTTGVLADANIASTIARDSEVSAAYQPLNANLTTYAGIAPSANVQSLLGAANYAAMRTQLGLVIGTDVLAPAGNGSALTGLTFTQLGGSATDAQIPNSITVDLATLATTAATANAGDSATAFFTSGQIERARGGTGADTSAFGTGLLGSDVTNATIDVDTIAEFSTALGTTGTPSATTFLRGDNTWATPAGAGSITAVGNVASGAAFDGTQGTILTFDDPDGDMTLKTNATANTFELSHPIDFGPTGVRVSGNGDGAITFKSLGDGFLEDMSIDIDDNSNQATFYSSTGLINYRFLGGTLIADMFSFAGLGDPADSGVIRIPNNLAIAWESSPASTDLTLLVDVNEQFVFSSGINVTGTGVFSGDVTVPTEVYDATGWNGDLSVPTKDAVRDKIEALVVGGGGDMFAANNLSELTNKATARTNLELNTPTGWASTDKLVTIGVPVANTAPLRLDAGSGLMVSTQPSGSASNIDLSFLPKGTASILQFTNSGFTSGFGITGTAYPGAAGIPAGEGITFFTGGTYYKATAAGLSLLSSADAAAQRTLLGAPGSNKQIIFNDGGIPGADADLTWDKTTNTLSFPTMATTTLTAQNFKVLDSVNQSHGLSWVVNGDWTTDKTLSYTGEYNLNITLSGDANITMPSGTVSVATNPNAAGFNGNLTTTDDTLQEIAQKVDDLVITGGTGGDIVSPLTAAEVSITGAATATISRMHVLTGASPYTLALPAASGNAGKFIGLRAAGLSGVATIDANASELINGVATLIMGGPNTSNESFILLCDGSAWFTAAIGGNSSGVGKLMREGGPSLYRGSTGPGNITIYEDSDFGFESITVQAPASLAASYTETKPPDDGDAGEQLTTDGNGVMTWEPAGAGSGTVTATGGALTLNQIVLGAGTVDTKVLGSLGTTTTVLHGNAAGAPTFGAVSLTADVSGDLPLANLAQGSALSLLGVAGNATADNASIVAASDGQVMRRSGAAIAFGAVDLASANSVTGILPDANIPAAIMRTRTGVRRTVYINAGSMISRTTNGAAAATINFATNNIMMDVFDFDSTTSEGVGFWWTPPTAYNGGTLTFKFHWTAASGSGTSTWVVAGRAIGDDDAIDQALGTSQTVTDTLTAVTDMDITSATAAVTLAGTPAANKPTYIQITRDTSIGGRVSADTRLAGCTIEYTESATEPAAQ